MWYNEAVAKGIDSADQTDSATSATEETKSASNGAQPQPVPSAKAFGEDGYKYPQLEFPATHEELANYNKAVRTRIEKKYETLTKNVHFYLTYLFLETGDFRNAVKHGQLVLKTYEGRLLKKTQFTVMQYLAEAHCMLNQHKEALNMLDEAQKLMEEGRSRSEEDTKLTVEMLTDKLIHGDKLATKTIV